RKEQGRIYEQDTDVYRNDSKKAARVKNSKVIRSSPGIKENSTDQESRQYEEKVYTGPGKASRSLQVGKERPGPSHQRELEIMKDEDHRNGDPSQPIKLRDAN
ncbi:MAG: hypothetical protein WA748_09070, partial [Candidatus Acidiferrum sp.]